VPEDTRVWRAVCQVQFAQFGAVVVEIQTVVVAIDGGGPGQAKACFEGQTQFGPVLQCLGHGQTNTAVGVVVVDKRGVCVHTVVNAQNAKVQLAVNVPDGAFLGLCQRGKRRQTKGCNGHCAKRVFHLHLKIP
jgi:hypothetical protein